MGFDAIPEDREQAFPCEVCNGNIKLSAVSGLWECDECGCLPGSKLVEDPVIQDLRDKYEELERALEDTSRSCDILTEQNAKQASMIRKVVREHAKTLTQIGADADSLRDFMDRMGKYEKALEQIANQPLEPAHIYEIADRIKLIAKVALEDK